MVILFLCFTINVGAYAGERGAVTAIAALGAQTSAFIGFATGDILYCARLSGCKPLAGTPKSAVTAIDIPRDGDSIMVWVGYEDGHIYFCTLTAGCLLQEQVLSGRMSGERGAGDSRIVK